MSADLARRVHDLVREPKARELFQRRTRQYIARRVRNRGKLIHLGYGRMAVPERAEPPPLPFDRFVPLFDEPFPDVTLAEKFAVLAAHHDNNYSDDGPILPRPDCANRESIVWYLVLGYVRDHMFRHSQRVEDWYKDVVTELGAGSAERAPLTATPTAHADAARRTKTVRRDPKDRDNYIYFAICDGTALKEIKNKVNANEDWQPLDQLPSISAAARRFAKKHNLPWPIAR